MHDPNMHDVYSGNMFSVSRHGDDWTIWRYTGQEFADARREELVLTTEAMDELRDYFAEDFGEQRDEVAAKREP